jgi:two-component system, chemotaxis family, chemotaxis protein CheY
MDPPAPSSRPPQGRPARVLYAEDLPDLRELMRLNLQRAGFQVETVAEGGAALQRLREHPGEIDLLITDHQMPGMNGLELVAQLRLLPYQGKVMVYSSELDPEVQHTYRRLGVHLILAKPVRPALLRRVVATLLPAAR